MASTIQVDKVQDTGGNTILSSNSTGTFTYEAASGANFTALDADNVSAGTLAIARGGTGAATLAAAGLDNTPSFFATNTMGISISDDTWTKVTCDSEAWDTDSAYDNSSNYRFTVPAGKAGKYIAWYGMYIPSLGDGDKGDAALRKNGSEIYLTEHRHIVGAAGELRIHGLAYPLSLAESDYIEFWARQISGGTLSIQADVSYFGCYKLIGV